ncbi:MAG TPA: endonuclease/exonuclease/phosphatase family protein [Parafilimonas sp.]|nr:endonuclease/exonuclease/phosphatase family protein [Parafilimonas sp.]
MMAVSMIRSTIKSILLVITVTVCFLYMLSVITPYLNPQHWWLVGFLGLMFPYLFFVLLFTFFFWLMVKPRLALLPFFILIFGAKQIAVTFAAHFNSTDLANKPAGTFRIISWNVANMYGLSNDREIKQHNRTELAQSILDLQPDIICLQEFNHSYTQGEGADNIGLFSKQYPNYFYSKDFNKENGYYTSGSIVFSKYPIIDSGKFDYPGNFTGSLIYIDVKVHDDTVRIFTTHLQSFGFNNADYAEINKIKQRDEKSIEASKNIFKKMKNAFTNRGVQADIVREQTDVCKYASVVCGDFNDVPSSYTYFHIRNLRQDAFLKKGLGVGKTYSSLAPMLRIDYILPDTSFSIQQFGMIDENLSDHAMLVSDLKLK